MAKDTKYGRLVVPGIGPDEPVFVLRAQDSVSVSTLLVYQGLARSKGSPASHVEGINRAIEAFCEWQAENSKLVKVPD